MPKARKQIISEIRQYMDGAPGTYSDWYVGVAENARQALFREHDVDKETDLWIYRTARSVRVAHAIRDFLRSTLGTQGSTEAGDADAKMVYAYLTVTREIS